MAPVATKPVSNGSTMKKLWMIGVTVASALAPPAFGWVIDTRVEAREQQKEIKYHDDRLHALEALESNRTSELREINKNLSSMEAMLGRLEERIIALNATLSKMIK